MKRMKLSELTGNEILAQSLMTWDYQIILPEGVVLKKEYISKIEEMGILEVYVKEDQANEIVILKNDIEKTIKNKVKSILERHTYHNNKELQGLTQAADEIITNILDEKEVIEKVFDIRDGFYYNTSRVFARCAMVLNVQKLINAPGERMTFQFDLDLSDVDFGGRRPAQNPVVVTGEVRNVAGMLLLDFTASTVLQSICDRCLKAFDQPKTVSYQCMLARELAGDEENDDIVLLEDGCVDVGDLARTQFILEMDTKTLCDPDCKGICPRCGVDLNQGSCTCKKEVDPRLAALAKLLDQDQDQ